MPDEWDPRLEMRGQVLLREIQAWDRRAGVRPWRPALEPPRNSSPRTAKIRARAHKSEPRHPSLADDIQIPHTADKRGGRHPSGTAPRERLLRGVQALSGRRKTSWTTSTLGKPAGKPGAAHPRLAACREKLRVAMGVCRPRPRISGVIAVRSSFFIHAQCE